ncbi:MAG: agmatinase family protein [Acidimicrobiia bacterium]
MSIVDPDWPRADEWLASTSEEPALAVVGVPSSSSSLVPSHAFETPTTFRKALTGFSTYHSELDLDVGALPVTDLGDWDVAGLDPDSARDAIGSLAAALPRGPVYAFLGGDNAITLPLVTGLAGDRLDRVSVLTLDAHHDVRTTLSGPSNGSPIRGLIEAGLPGQHVAQVGIHSFANSAEYRAFCEDQGFFIVTMDTISDWGVPDAVEVALDHLSQRSDWIYVDIDLDVLDRAYAPACPGSRPGGLTPRQLAEAARICGRHPKVQAADLVEVDSPADRDGITVMAMAHTFLSFSAGLADRAGSQE